MKFQTYGKYNPNQTVKTNPSKFVDYEVLEGLDHLLGKLEEFDIEIHEKYLEKLNMRLKSLIDKDIVSSNDIEELIDKYLHLKDYPQLAENSVNYSFDLMGLTDGNWDSPEIKLSEKEKLRGFIYPKYLHLHVLTQILGREEAIKFYKEQVNQLIGSFTDLQQINDVETLRGNYIRGAQHGGEVRTIGEVVDGKVINRKDTCLWAEIINEVSDDNELSNAVICFPDFKHAEMRNQNFVMTRNYTIVDGDPYCDQMVHDISINSNIDHPPKEFFDNIQPISEGE
ncbi:MAG: hypothetical protein ACXAD7_18965 [Candidatus Kariarchaeaceae archaeon]|jgi:hypothetical protein